jgi:hypothetical protein
MSLETHFGVYSAAHVVLNSPFVGGRKDELDGAEALDQTPTRTPKRSGVQERAETQSELPTRRPSEVYARLPEDPEEAAHDPRVVAMRELYAAGDIEAALFIARTIDATPPGRVSTEAETAPPPPLDAAASGGSYDIGPDGDVGDRNAQAAAFYARRAASQPPTRSVPHIAKTAQEIAALPLDHHAGFLLAHVDGLTSVDEILDLCAMPEEEAITLLQELLVLGVIQFGPPRSS